MIPFILIALLLSGCSSDSSEIDDQVYTLVIGVDKGIGNAIRMTVQYPVYKEGGGGGGGGGTEKKGGGGESDESGAVDGTVVQTVEAPSILEAVNLLNTSVSRRISFMHTKMLIFSEQFAREGIGKYLDAMARFREIRRNMSVVVCKGKAADFIKENKSQIGTSASKAMELMINQSKVTGFFPMADFHEFYSGIVSPYGQAYAIYGGLNDFREMRPDNTGANVPPRTLAGLEPGKVPRAGGAKWEFAGMAVFDGDRMVGTMDTYETRYFMMVAGRYQKGILSVKDQNISDGVIPLDIRLGRKPKLYGHFENGVPVIDIKLLVEVDLGAIQSGRHYASREEIGSLNQYISSTIKDGIQKTIRKTQKEYGSDIFNFGRLFAKYFRTIPEFEKYNWIVHYKDAKVNINVESDIRRTGLMIGSTPTRSTTDNASSPKR